MNPNIATVLAGLRLQVAVQAGYMGITLNALHAFFSRPEVEALANRLAVKATAEEKELILAQAAAFAEEALGEDRSGVDEVIIAAIEGLAQYLAIFDQGADEDQEALDGLSDVMVEGAAKTRALRELLVHIAELSDGVSPTLKGMTIESAALNAAVRLAKGFSGDQVRRMMVDVYADPVLTWNSKGPGKVGPSRVVEVVDAVTLHLPVFAAMVAQTAADAVATDQDDADTSWVGELFMDAVRGSFEAGS